MHRYVLWGAWLLFIVPTSIHAAADTESAMNAVQAVGAHPFPRTIEVNGGLVVFHAPQIRSWQDFETITGVAAVETVPDDGRAPRFGVLGFKARAVPDLDARIVNLHDIEITSLKERGEEVPPPTRELVVSGLSLAARNVPLDLVLSHLADGVLPETTPDIKLQPPRIMVSTVPAIIVLLQGEPVLVPVDGAGLKFAANTNWPLFRIGGSGEWYLLNNDDWLVATGLNGRWSWPESLPSGLKGLPENGNWRTTRKSAAAWTGPPADRQPPHVFVETTPAELILLDGDPQLVEIADTGLSYASNTDSELYSYQARWYYLVSGRWFTSATLDRDWIAVLELPEVFAEIPEDHEKADVLTTVPGTPAARMAALDAQIPKKMQVPADLTVPEAVTYVGEPSFEAIAETDLKRATNTPYTVIQAGSDFYLCYSGMWYVAGAPTGPWSVARSVPPAIYQIPPSSPAYHTTYVGVYDSTPTTVTVGYTSGYSGIYVVNGVPVYGTGWYYPPYYYYYGGYPIYFGYPYTFGSGSYYNPHTGAYRSVSAAYGPYGGWGYSSSYNPRTGTYGRAEAVWDYDEWYAEGQAYNPRTGRYYDTERYYDADDGDWEIDSTFGGPHGEVDVSRRFDDDSGRVTISTSRGGEGTFTRERSGDGWDTGSEFTTADGRTITGSGRYEDGEGSSTLHGSQGGTGTIERSVDEDGITREGTYTKGDKTIETETTRDGSGPRTHFETSGGAQGAVVGRGAERTTVAQTEAGDVYAAHDGNVYKRTDDGWSRRSDDGWETIDRPERSAERSHGSFGSAYGSAAVDSGRSAYGGTGGAGGDWESGLRRDYSARRRGMSRAEGFNRRFGGRAGTVRRR